MREFFTLNPGLKLLSLVFALIAWYYVIIAVNPAVFRVYRINLDVYDRQGNLEYTGIPQKIEMEVAGRRLDLIQLFRTSPYPVQAYISLEGITRETQIQIRTKKLVNVEDFSIIGPRPSTVRIGVTRLDERRFQVTHTLLGSPERGYRIEKVRIEPDRVRVLGVRNVMEKLKSAQVTVDISGVTTERVFNLPVQFFDDHGEALQGLRQVPEGMVKVIIEARKWPEKTIPLKATIIGREPDGYQFVEANAKPSTIIIRGPAAELAAMDSLSLEPVDVTGVTGEKSFAARIEPVRGNLAILGDTRVAVNVVIKPRYGSLELSDIEVKMTNIPPGMEAEAVPSRLNLKISGRENELRGLDAGVILARVDLRRVLPGTEVEPEIVFPRDRKSLKVDNTVRVRITLKARTGEAPPREPGQN
ncbi:MAG: hypothetical protein CVV64_06435 [Candidatus Wallbacteria bacterium HGW-Wallbacteria-1]|jgi:YbbR domain-containing protein|uniref:YbbR-like domain-containing protein n=1 Tax=Candidatus Wallbacteria bacterium HGW-Wallbacteria-1 TaxID=2013854 RepID=A0A2N1PSS8_9BACT|nr:MAG: hypothetical protein CVV64_06435 [Candidatus Wallbacteria bacterium HGW-Wallbacteria-1]